MTRNFKDLVIGCNAKGQFEAALYPKNEAVEQKSIGIDFQFSISANFQTHLTVPFVLRKDHAVRGIVVNHYSKLESGENYKAELFKTNPHNGGSRTIMANFRCEGTLLNPLAASERTYICSWPKSPPVLNI